MKFFETLVRFIFWPRVQKAKKIGHAAELIGQGRAEESLELLRSMETRIPPYLGHLFFLTRGRAFDELGQEDDAEKDYTAAVFAKQGGSVAYIHLIVLEGRRRNFEAARDWIRRLRDDEELDEELAAQADELEAMLDDVESGRRREEMAERASEFAELHDLAELELVTACKRLDQWIDESRESCLEECDELACFLGERFQDERSGQWLVSLDLSSSIIEYPDGIFSPFELVERRLQDEETLVEGIDGLGKSGSDSS